MAAQAKIHRCSEQGIAGLKPTWVSRTGPPEVKKITWRMKAESQVPQKQQGCYGFLYLEFMRLITVNRTTQVTEGW